MKNLIIDLLSHSVQSLKQTGVLPEDTQVDIRVENTRDKTHGDLASNIAMSLAKAARCKPRELAEQLCSALPASEQVIRTEIAGPGFINFFLNPLARYTVLMDILEQAQCFGLQQAGSKPAIQIEFVSANPTGPLHVGHGRGAAYGATLANILEAAGYSVQREYYVNDNGRQMHILAVSVWLRYLENRGLHLVFPSNAYQGDYITDIATSMAQQVGDAFVYPLEHVFSELPADEPEGGDKDVYIDALIERAQSLLKNDYDTVFNAGLHTILADIRDDLHAFGVDYDQWFSERSLSSSNAIDNALERLQQLGHLYEQEGTLWFRSSAFGDDKDRVVKRANGQATYFASDIAYHMHKFERGFDHVINIWGADHHGYISRVKAAMSALGYDPERLVVKLVQFAILYRGEERLQMSTRSGSFITLRALRDEVGKDACRFFYVTRKAEQHMDFDLELAKSQSKDNPIYYIQYAHARACSVLRKLSEQGLTWQATEGLAAANALQEEIEQDILVQLSVYPESLMLAAQHYEPHQLATYLRELASLYHSWYNGHKIILDDKPLRDARITLSEAVKQVIANGLQLLGATAPEQM